MIGSNLGFFMFLGKKQSLGMLGQRYVTKHPTYRSDLAKYQEF